MKLVNVYNHYDETKTVIARVRVDETNPTISQRTYNSLLKKRTVGGDAGIYTANGNVTVLDKYGNPQFTI